MDKQEHIPKLGIWCKLLGRHIDKQEQHTRRKAPKEYMPVHSLPLPASGCLLVLPSGESEKRIERRALPAVFSAVCLSPSARGKSVRVNIIYMASRIFHKFRSPFFLCTAIYCLCVFPCIFRDLCYTNHRNIDGNS